ncbi:MAG: hypothetical protein ACI8RZ_002322 [Myxococcota bacterium]|jgi:uncharacterized protein (DUF1501 family)
MPLSRRRLLTLAPAAGLLLPGRLGRATRSASERRFLFIFAEGGWDTTFAFTPQFDSPHVDMPANALAAEIGGIPFVDHPEIPALRQYLKRYSSQTCVINGLEIPSVAHEMSQRLILTDSSLQGFDDWPSILAGHATTAPIAPMLHISGPTFAAQYASSVVRIGTTGQLTALLDGTALTESTHSVTVPSSTAEALENARAIARAEAYQATVGSGRGAQIAQTAAHLESQMGAFSGYADQLSFSSSTDLIDQLAVPLSFLSSGASRCAMVSYKAWNGVFNGWDTHEELTLQAPHFEELFTALTHVLDTLTATPGLSGGTLADEITIVVLSEMGRTPLLNSTNGKDHWTYTSAMLIGAGVAGGQAIGGYTNQLLGEKTDLSSGTVTDHGVDLLPGHIGATLLALGDVDPGLYTDEAKVITAALA